MSDLDIPEFLQLTQAERRAGWKDRKLTKPKPDKVPPWGLPRSMDAEGHRLLREQERAAEARKQERLAALKAWKEANR